MRPIGSAEVREILKSHSAAGFHVDGRLFREIEQPGAMFIVPLPTVEGFLNLVWQSISDARPLVPIGEARTLRDCAARLANFGWRFQALVDEGFPWFDKCCFIDRSFDYSKLGWIVVTTLIDDERRSNPRGSHYIYDGAHKSIVLAKKLATGELEYRPVEVLLLTPRRH
jgi:hypothetical protein